MQVDTIQLQVFDVNNHTEKEWQDYVALRHASFKEVNPDDKLPPESVLRQALTASEEAKRNKQYRWLIYKAGESKAIGLANMGRLTAHHEDYEKQKHISFAGIYVLPDHRRQGIGTEVMHTFVSVMEEHNLTQMEAWVNIADGIAFAQKFGATQALRMVTNRLQLADIDWEMVEQWNKDGQEKNPDTQLVLSTEILDQALLQPFADLVKDIFDQMPKEDADTFPENVTVARVTEWFELAKKYGENHLTAFTLEPDGSMSAMTEVYWHPERDHEIEQGLTGVHREQRGRGLGKWVKAVALLYLRDAVPNAEYVDTENANVNAAMLHINEKLGFKFYKQNITFKLKRDDIVW